MAERKMDFPSNSKNSGQSRPASTNSKPSEKPELSQITSGKAVQKKKSLGTKIRDLFMSDDAHSIGSYVLFEIVVPSAKDLLFDVITQGSARSLFGASDTIHRGGSRGGTYRSYGQRYRESDRTPTTRVASDRNRQRHNFKDIVLDNGAEAQEVIDILAETVAKYGVVTVADLYNLTGISTEFTDNQFGWYELRNARVLRTRDGFILDIPSPELLDQ